MEVEVSVRIMLFYHTFVGHVYLVKRHK